MTLKCYSIWLPSTTQTSFPTYYLLTYSISASLKKALRSGLWQLPLPLWETLFFQIPLFWLHDFLQIFARMSTYHWGPPLPSYIKWQPFFLYSTIFSQYHLSLAVTYLLINLLTPPLESKLPEDRDFYLFVFTILSYIPKTVPSTQHTLKYCYFQQSEQII